MRVVVCTDLIRQVGRVLRHDGEVHVVDDASQLQTTRHDAVIAVHAVPAGHSQGTQMPKNYNKHKYYYTTSKSTINSIRMYMYCRTHETLNIKCRTDVTD